MAKSPKSISGVLIAISGPMILAKISISNDIPSSNWNTILDLNRPSLVGVNLILKTTSSPKDIFNLSFTFNNCSSPLLLLSLSLSFSSILFSSKFVFVFLDILNFDCVFLLLVLLVFVLLLKPVFESFNAGVSFSFCLSLLKFVLLKAFEVLSSNALLSGFSFFSPVVKFAFFVYISI